MSDNPFRVCGIGFDVRCVSRNAYLRFLRSHAKATDLDTEAVIADILAYAEEDWQKVFRETYAENYSLASPIAAIIRREACISMDAPGLTDVYEDFVLYRASYPWQMTPKERNLTYRELVSILKGYADELGVTLEEDADLVYSG